MKLKHTIYLFLLLLIGCRNGPGNDSSNIQMSNHTVANEFVDAFYSFNRDSLESMMIHASKSQPNILYYQKWAECGHYKILKRGNAIEKNDSLLLLPITVKDDLMSALHIDFNVTDTFRITMKNGQIYSVETSSNDPDEYYKAKEWVKKNRPELVEKACEGIWEGGPTPCECIQGMIKGFAGFVKEKTIKTN